MSANASALIRAGIQPYGGASFSAVGIVQTRAALKALSVSGLTTGYAVSVLGRTSVSDGWEGVFKYDSTSVATANDATIVAPTIGSGRWLRVYSNLVNALWFMVGDDATDDTAGWVAAITAAAGKKLILPGGKTYKLNGDGSMGSSNIEIVGEGMPVLKQYSTNNYHLAVGLGTTNILIRGIKFITNGSTGGSGTAIGINVGANASQPSNIWIDQCIFGSPCNVIGIGGGWCTGLRVTRNEIVLGAQGQHGLYVINVTDIIVDDNDVIGPGAGSPTFPSAIGLKLIGCDNARVTTNRVKTWLDIGIDIDTQALANSPTKTIIANNEVSSITGGVSNTGINVNSSTDTIIEGNRVSDCPLSGITVNGTRTTISNNQVINCGTSGAQTALSCGGANATICGNLVTGFDTGFGIAVAANASGTYNLTSNILIGNSASRGITVSSGSTASGNISGNLITGATSLIVLNGKTYTIDGGGLPTVAAAATTGFVNIPVLAGAPSGVPANQLGQVFAAYDPATNKLWVYNVSSSAWKSVTLA